MMRPGAVLVAAAIACFVPARALQAASVDEVRSLVAQACGAETPSEVYAIVRSIADPTVWPPPRVRVSILGWRADIGLPDGALAVERVPMRGAGKVRIEMNDTHRSALLAIADETCAIKLARRLVFESGRAAWIEELDSDLQPTGRREPLNPPVPPGRDIGTVPVALVDTGVNYTLAEIAARLTRDAQGEIVGYDFWDMDARPFDADFGRSRFLPGRHGTNTAALLLRSAPIASLAAYRYPHGDMDRMGALVENVRDNGIRLVNVSLTGERESDWLAFKEAVAAHPELLVIAAAGNGGRNLDEDPVYPAALGLPNILTVTAATEMGTLMPEANWGPGVVDLMAPAERLTTTGFDGHPITVSGSSYAAVRVTAMAACILAAHPGLSSAELRQIILDRARTAYGRDRVRSGFLSDIALGPADKCRPPTAGGGARSAKARH